MGNYQITSWSIVGPRFEDQAVASRTENGRLQAEVTGPTERFQVPRTDAEPHPPRRIPIVDLLNDCVDLRPDGRNIEYNSESLRSVPNCSIMSTDEPTSS
jgi:hypothetical protein